MNDFFEFLACFFALVAFMVALIVGGIYWSNSSGCANVHRLTGLDTDMTLSLGCMVQYQGRWVDASVVTANKQEVTVRADK
ncbi:hypothetical protein SE92_07600 [Bradyrhizobium sp. AT1]|nr:hypothetical protein SE92_07600 [Bradyrhizobium sp. AT1]